MRNKKGFTLIELLAIIVILAIIAAITVPIILDIIDNSKKGTVKDSAYGYKDAINKWYVSKLSSDPDYDIPDDTYSTDTLKNNFKVSYNGQEPESNSWVAIANNNVTDGCLQFNEYKVEISDGKVGNAEKGQCEAASSTTSSVVIVSGTKGNLQTGDIVKIGDTEEFYVISSDNTSGGKTVVISKYNLLVGNSVSSFVVTPIPTTTSGYGLQSADYSGYDGIHDDYKGTINFFDEDENYKDDIYYYGYWYDSTSGLKSTYSSNGASYSGNPYPYVYDSNSKLYSIINTYVNTLKSDFGAPSSITGRLLKFEDAIIAGCVDDGFGQLLCSGSSAFLLDTSYWLGSVLSESNVYMSYNDVYISRNSFDANTSAGVRPVIEINTSDIR